MDRVKYVLICPTYILFIDVLIQTVNLILILIGSRTPFFCFYFVWPVGVLHTIHCPEWILYNQLRLIVKGRYSFEDLIIGLRDFDLFILFGGLKEMSFKLVIRYRFRQCILLRKWRRVIFFFCLFSLIQVNFFFSNCFTSRISSKYKLYSRT